MNTEIVENSTIYTYVCGEDVRMESVHSIETYLNGFIINTKSQKGTGGVGKYKYLCKTIETGVSIQGKRKSDAGIKICTISSRLSLAILAKMEHRKYLIKRLRDVNKQDAALLPSLRIAEGIRSGRPKKESCS